MKKKILSLLLAVVMLTSILPTSAMTALATIRSDRVSYNNIQVGDIITRGSTITKSTSYFYVEDSRYSSTKSYIAPNCIYVRSKGTEKHGDAQVTTIRIENACNSNTQGTLKTAATCTAAAVYNYKCSYCETNTGTKSVGDPLDHDYSVYQSVKTPETCTANRVDNYKCANCSATTTKTIDNTKLSHSYTKPGSLVSEATCTSPAVYKKQCATCTATSGTMEVGSAKGHTWVNATIDAPKTCSTCKATEGSKLPSAYINYVDPITKEEVVVEPTNDTVKTEVDKLMKKPMQKKNDIFLGWFTGANADKALNSQTTRFDQLTEITAQFTGIGKFNRDKHNDEKNIDEYLDFGLAGAQIRSDNTAEKNVENDVYGGLRFVASFSEELIDRIGYGNIAEYGFVVATKENADANAHGNDDYVIKNGDKNVKRVNCMTGIDHRNFGYYRLFTMVVDYAGNEALKNQELVVRPYIVYTDANGVKRIFYGSYEGTNTYGGMAMSYTEAMNYTGVAV